MYQDSQLVRAAARAHTTADLGELLRMLHQRQGRLRPDGPLSYRALAARLGSSHGIIGEYLAGRVLPPLQRFDALVALLGASSAEKDLLAKARDEVDESRVRSRATAVGCFSGPG